MFASREKHNMKTKFNILSASLVGIVCASIMTPSFAASSVRSLGGTGTYTGTSSVRSNTAAATSGSTVTAARAGSIRINNGTTATKTNTGASLRTPSTRSATAPRLSIGKYLAGSSALGGGSSTGGSVNVGQSGVTSSDIKDLQDGLAALEKEISNMTGGAADVEFEYDHATLPANNAALVIFPNGGINGASEDFVITKLEFTNGVNYLDARTGWVNNDKDAYTITEGAGSVTIKKNDSWVNAEGATCGTEWCFAKNIIEVVDGKYTTLVVKFTSDVANQEFIFYFNGKEVKPFTNAGEQEIEIVLDAPITSAELRIFANAGQIGSCTLVITDMYLK